MLEDFSIFYKKQYIDLYLKDNEEIFSFLYSEGDLLFKNIAIKSPIPGTNLYDMSSSYGYSGYLTNSKDSFFLSRALDEQSKKALKENIIAEFIRFHPLYPEASLFESKLDFFKRDRMIVTVKLNREERWGTYSSKMRNQIRQSQSIHNFQLSHDYDKMFEIYTLAMSKKNADIFYYFSKDYFRKILELENCFMLEATRDRQTCAMAIFLYDQNYAYYHLSATTPYDKTSSVGSMRGLLESAFCFLEAKQLHSCILGGGTTPNEDDSLFLFKKKFSSTLYPFYIGGKIYDYQAYQELSREHRNKYFLKYRYKNNQGGGGDIK